MLGWCQLQLTSLTLMNVLQSPLLNEGWGGRPLCLSGDGGCSVLMDLHRLPISPNLFNTHFLTLAETVAQSSGCITESFVCSTLLRNLCSKKQKPDDSFCIPPMAVFDVGGCISKMANNKSTGQDSVSPFLMKLALH